MSYLVLVVALTVAAGATGHRAARFAWWRAGSVVVAAVAVAALYPLTCAVCSDCLADQRSVASCQTLLGLDIAGVGPRPDVVGLAAVATVVILYLVAGAWRGRPSR